jgi:hypothetical protein
MVSPHGARAHHPLGVIAGHPPRLETRAVTARRIGVTALLVLGTLFWTAFGLGLWAKRQALNTDNWVETSDRLLEDEQIRSALAVFIVDKLYDSEAVQTRLEDALPPRLEGLAGPAAAGLKEIATRNAPRVLGSAAALNAWQTANRTAHEQLLNIIDNGVLGRDVSLDLKSLVEEVASGTGLPASAADRLPPNVANLTIATPDELDNVRDLLHLFETLVWVLLVLALACFAGAVAIARDRRRTVLNLGGCLMFAGIAILAFRTLAGKYVVDSLAEAPNAHDVADDAWGIVTRLMVDIAEGTLLFGFFILVGAWLIGPGRRATATRRFSAYTLREQAGVTRAVLAFLILLLVIWGPVPWTQRFWTIVLFTVIAFAWLERIRYRTVSEFPEEPAPTWSGLRPRFTRAG